MWVSKPLRSSAGALNSNEYSGMPPAVAARYNEMAGGGPPAVAPAASRTSVGSAASPALTPAWIQELQAQCAAAVHEVAQLRAALAAERAQREDDAARIREETLRDALTVVRSGGLSSLEEYMGLPPSTPTYPPAPALSRDHDKPHNVHVPPRHMAPTAVAPCVLTDNAAREELHAGLRRAILSLSHTHINH